MGLTLGRSGRPAPANFPDPGSIPAMAASGGSVLVINSGSSSVKFALITAGTGERVLGGLADKVGTPEAVLRIQRPADDVTEPVPGSSRPAVIARILDRAAGPGADLIGAGHRVVHGGNRFSDSVLVDDDVIAAIRSFAPLAPLQNPAGPDAAELTETLNTRSGLLGLSGTSNDMRAVQDAAARGDGRARLALDVFVHRLAKAVAGLVTSLERLDALVFTGGIGENSAVVRGLVLARLRFLGLAEDPDANAVHGRSTGGRISRPGPVQALVIPTDEELMI